MNNLKHNTIALLKGTVIATIVFSLVAGFFLVGRAHPMFALSACTLLFLGVVGFVIAANCGWFR